MRHTSLIIGLSVGLSASVVITSPAAGMTLFTLDFVTAPDGTVLDANRLDGVGQTVEGVHYSTTNRNIGQIWNPLGIDITVVPNAGTSPLALVNSNCEPFGGRSLDGFVPSCMQGGDGDNDLATGRGYNPQGEAIINPSSPVSQQYNYDSIPQGNVLAIEANVGNGVPDDTGNGGVIRFDFNRDINNGTALQSVILDKIGIVDDVDGQIRVKFLNDNSLFTQAITNTQENELQFFSVNTAQQVDYIEVEYGGSGAVSGLHFVDFQTTTVPTPALLPGLMGLGIAALRKRKKALKLER